MYHSLTKKSKRRVGTLSSVLVLNHERVFMRLYHPLGVESIIIE